jgi:hypothetical protein
MREAVMGANVVMVNDVLDGHVALDGMLSLWSV